MTFFPKAPVRTAPDQRTESIAFAKIPAWLFNAFGLAARLVPAQLRIRSVQPVVDVYRPPLTVMTYPAPANNATATVHLPVVADGEWLLVALTFRYTTSIAAANRTIRVTDLTSSYHAMGNFTQVASVTADYAFAATGIVGNTSSVGGAGGTNAILIPAPVGLIIPSGGSLLIEVSAADVGDVLSAITVTAFQRGAGGFVSLFGPDLQQP